MYAEFNHYDFHLPHHPANPVQLEVVKSGQIIRNPHKIDKFKEIYHTGLSQTVRIDRAKVFLCNFGRIDENDLLKIGNPEDDVLAKIIYQSEDKDGNHTTSEQSFSVRAHGKVFVASEYEAYLFQRIALKHPRGHGKFIFDIYHSSEDSFNSLTINALKEIKAGSFKRLHLF